MKEVCTSCQSSRTAPVLDLRLTRQAGGGNPYRARCLECQSHYLRAGKSDWSNHTNPLVLPRAADSSEEDSAVPLREFDAIDDLPASAPDAEAVMKRAAQLREEGHEFEVVDEQDDGGEEGESGNRFECPSCGDVVEGYPDECPSCEASYNWN